MQASDFIMFDGRVPPGMYYRRLGESDLDVSVISLSVQFDRAECKSKAEQRDLIECALDLGVNHYRLTSSQSSPLGVYEACRNSIFCRREDMVISAQVGFSPHGSSVGFGARERILASLDAILWRTGLEYLDVLCSHRYDPSVPLEETMGALASAVHQGRVRYVGLSGYAPSPARRAAELLVELGTPAIACFGPFSVMHPWIEDGLLQLLDEKSIGFLSDAPMPNCFLSAASWGEHGAYCGTGCAPPDRELTAAMFAKLAASRGQSPAGLALSWVLRKKQVSSALVAAATPTQLEDYCAVVDHLDFTADELALIDSLRV
ncbi:aldo/keto reductase [Streptomyces sp. NPDC056254]|uniref:aldo/keto reductase n=1 Tax=Streptomyces sp. NPDC056254 TaxID=3345763 RepID=UPI0035DF16B4